MSVNTWVHTSRSHLKKNSYFFSLLGWGIYHFILLKYDSTMQGRHISLSEHEIYGMQIVFW